MTSTPIRKQYYRSRIDEISSMEVLRVFQDLLAAGRREPGEGFDMQVHTWLVWFFQQKPLRDLKETDFALPDSPLTTSLKKLSKTEVFTLCQEIGENRLGSRGIELYESKKLLIFLKKIFSA